MKALLPIGVIAFLIGMAVYDTVRGWCRLAPARRPWLIALSIITLGLVVTLAPGIGKLKPPFSESPSGLFVILGRVAVLGLASVLAVATLLGASRSADPDRSDPTA